MRLMILLAAISFPVWPNVPGDTWFVDKANTGTQDGLNWDTAFSEIQPAIDAASIDGGGEVWVANGLYDEVRDIDASGWLLIRSDVSLFGGFAGHESNRDERDPATNGTVIDGSLAANGSHAARVVKTENNSLVDGFTITNRVTNGEETIAGGLLNEEAATIVRNVIFRENGSESSGAIHNFRGNVVIEDSIFEQNFAFGDDAGALHSSTGDIRISRCIFRNNRAEESGGAIQIISGVALLEDCIFLNNAGTISSGAIDVQNGNVAVERSQFINNIITNGSGGAARINNARVTFTNCLFAGNESAAGGGAISASGNTGFPDLVMWNSTTMLTNCTVVDNVAASGGGAFSVGTVQFLLQNSIVWDNGATPITLSLPSQTFVRMDHALIEGGFDGTGIFDYAEDTILDADPMFAAPAEGDYRLLEGSPALDAADDALAPETDIDETARPQGAASDLGAYEGAVPVATLELDVEGEGTTEPPPGETTAAAGTELTLTATPAAGWTFCEWTGDLPFAADPTANPLTLTLAADAALTAVFAMAEKPKCGMAAGNANPTRRSGDALLILALPLILAAARLTQQRTQRVAIG